MVVSLWDAGICEAAAPLFAYPACVTDASAATVCVYLVNFFSNAMLEPAVHAQRFKEEVTGTVLHP